MEAVIISLGLGILLLLGGLVLWRRSASRSNDAAPSPSPPAAAAEPAELVVPLPNARGEALVLAGSGEQRVVPLSEELRARFDAGEPAAAAAAAKAAESAMAAALGQQLDQLEARLTGLRETLDRIAGAAGPRQLEGAAGAPAALDAELKLLSGTPIELSRAERVAQLDHLLGQERFDRWLARRVEAELADTRSDRLRLEAEPDAVRQSIVARQRRMALLGVVLADLSDPQSRRPLDPLRQRSRRRLVERSQLVEQVLPKHADAFAAPEHDPYAVTDARPDQVRVLSGGS